MYVRGLYVWWRIDPLLQVGACPGSEVPAPGSCQRQGNSIEDVQPYLWLSILDTWGSGMSAGL